MANTTSTSVLGFDSLRATALAEFAPGTTVISGKDSYTYAKAAAAIAAAGTVNLDGSFLSGAGSTYTHDLVAPGVLINQYFWAKKATSPF